MCRCGSPPMLFIMIPDFLAEDNANPKHVISGSERILLLWLSSAAKNNDFNKLHLHRACQPTMQSA